MCPCFSKQFVVAALLPLLITACSSSVHTGNLGHVQLAAPDAGATEHGAQGTAGTAESGNTQAQSAPSLPLVNRYGERFDGDAEENIARRSVAAWRTAIAHDKEGSEDQASWQKTRAADERSAMEQLEALEKAYPTQSTVQFMKGQVAEHFGHHEAAITFYRQASQKNLISSMTLFKLAENERMAGKNKDAVDDYRKLLHGQPNFVPAEVGLARALLALDVKSSEARSLAQKAVADDPQDTQAKKLLAELTGAGKGSGLSAGSGAN